MLRDRDRSGFEELHRHQTTLLRDAIGLTRNRDDGLDLVQDTYERALRTFGRFEPGTNGLGWLRTIMRRLYIDGWRRRRHRPIDLVADLAELVPANDEDPPARWRTVSEHDLQAAMRALPTSSRAVLEGRLIDHESYASLAGRLRVPVKTVGTRLHRGRAKLRKLLLQAA